MLNESYVVISNARQTSKSNAKLEFLKSAVENETLQELLKYTYNPFYKYHVKQFVKNPPCSEGKYNNQIFDVLDELRHRLVTGNEAIQKLEMLYAGCDEIHQDLLECIIDKDLKAGISSKTINKVWKGLIPETPYQRCSKLDDKIIKNITYPAVCQLKADGMFVYGIKVNDVVMFMTRNGHTFDCPRVADEMLKVQCDYVLMGEFVLEIDGKIADRKTGNGLITSYVKRENTKETSERLKEWEDTEQDIRFQVWDSVTYQEFYNGESKRTYKNRSVDLYSHVLPKFDSTVIDHIVGYTVNSLGEAQRQANIWMDAGFEGAILKDLSEFWQNKTSKKMLKIKAVLDADLKCVGVEEGTGKNDGKVGALVLEGYIDDDFIQVKVGTGLTDEDREKPFEYYIGKTIEVQYNEVIKAKGKEHKSLFLPVFVEVRFDK